jgi:two-component SAPR family response regulator
MAHADALQGVRVLVVEDDFLLAETLTETLAEAGAVVLGPIGWLDQARAFVRQHGADLSGAVLDVNLHGQAVYPIADLLVERDIRFVFLTGYDQGALDPAYRGFPRCEKPCPPEAILAALAAALA